MPQILFMFESCETGEFEPDANGDPLPIVQMDLHQYANMSVLKDALSPSIFDQVRESLGLDSLLIAAEKGMKVTKNVRNAVT